MAIFLPPEIGRDLMETKHVIITIIIIIIVIFWAGSQKFGSDSSWAFASSMKITEANQLKLLIKS